MFLDPKNHNPDGIIGDDKTLAIKSKVMDRLKGKNIYDAISKVSMFLGTMITTAGMSFVMGGLLHAAGAAGGLSAAGGVIGALGAAMNPAVIGVLAVGLAIIGVAVATDYVSSHIGQGANFDIQEAAAQSTARSMRVEFDDLVPVLAAGYKQMEQKNWTAQAEAEKLKRDQEVQKQH